jgi:hypothetical protein
MGDSADLSQVLHFTRSPEGKRALEKFRQGILGKKINDVSYCELSTGVSITLHFEGGEHLDLTIVEQAFSINSLRQRYGRVLEREYFSDFPHRQPGRRSP